MHETIDNKAISSVGHRRQNYQDIRSSGGTVAKKPLDSRKTMFKVLDPSIHSVTRRKSRMNGIDSDNDELSSSMMRSAIGKGLEPNIELKRPSRYQYLTANLSRMPLKDKSPVLDELRRKVHDQDIEIT